VIANKNIMKTTFTLLFTLLTISLFAQNIEFTKDNFPNQKDQLKEAKKQLDEGDYYYNMRQAGKYKFALDLYLKANQFNPNNALLNYKIGICYLYSNFKIKSLPHFKKAFELNPNVDPEIQYYLGRAYHLSMEWDNAIDAYEKYKQTLVGKKADENKIKDVIKKMKECGFGKEFVKTPVRVFIDNAGPKINTQYSENVPVISADEDILMFTSRRNTTTGGAIDENYDEYFEDIYRSYKFNEEWTLPTNIGPPINTPKHDATINLSPDGQKLFTYRDNKGSGDIYVSDLVGDNWTAPEKMSKAINSSYHESHASISYDGRTIYFTSERPEGSIGGRDIWMSVADNKGKWEKAENLGLPINTEYNEEAVFIVADGKTMYFSSQGHNSMGGYDIFKSVYNNGKWSTPENLGFPINTPDDDVFFVIAASGKRGYYASVKPDGYGDSDIYMITFLGPEKPVILDNEDNLLASVAAPIKEIAIAPTIEIIENQVTLLKGIVTDALTKQTLEAEIILIDNVKNLEIASFKSNSKTGKYLVTLPSGVNYGIAVKKDGYLFHSENFDIPATASYQEVVKDIELKNITVGNKIVLKNIFFDFDRATLRTESTAELERLTKLLNDVPTLKIEISGHTDNKGAAQYNQTLSENRAKSVVEYLIQKGIDKNRLEYKGYGLTQPIAGNETDEGRQLNRRTEFKILSK
jgi:outer membrane protein OmpA-like peptidoglycan-associated protein/tetratricopeptide (TPR) repeat protein